MGNTRNTGYLQNIVQYDASNNITLPARLAVTGTVSINNTTPYDTTQFSLDVNGGLIVKNINKTAQFVLINSNPATGGNNAFVVHTVGGTSATSYADIQGYYGTSISGSTVLRLNPLGGNVLVGSLAGTGSRMVVASATGVLSTQAIVTLGDLSGVSTARALTINGTTYDLSADRTWTLYTDNISEDASPVNLWFTNARARAAISVTGSGSYDSATGVITVTGGVTSVNTLTGAVTLTTSNISEGTNLYYTDARVGSYLTTNNYATTTYVGTQIANLVASAPATLDTLNELAAALGNDAAFSTTVSTALGNRLRVDINTQGLSATLQGYGRTNLGLGTAATANTGDFAAASHTHSIANVTGLQTALDGKQASGSYAASVHTHIISDVTGLQTALDGKQASLGFTPYNATNPSGYISSYTETDTLATVTGRGATTSTAITISNTLTVGSTLYANTGNEYLRNTAGAVNNAQFQTWFNSAGTRRGYFGYGSGGSNTLELNNESGGQVLINGGDFIANANYFRMKGSGGAAEFVWYKDYSGSPSEPGFVINNRAGNTTFYHNANGGGTGVSGSFTAAGAISASNFSGSHSGTSSGTNTGDQIDINGNAATSYTTGSVQGRSRGSFTIGGNTSTFYPVAFGIGSGSTDRQGVAVIQIERGGYDEPGYSNYTFSTFHCRIRAKADGWGYGASYVQVEANAYTTPMLADVSQQNQTSQLIVWLRGGCSYRWLDIEGSAGLNFGNPSGTSYTTFNGNAVYNSTTTNNIGSNFKYQTGWGDNFISGKLTASSASLGAITGNSGTLNVAYSIAVRGNLTGNEQNLFHVGNTGSGVNDGYMRLFRDGVVKVLIAADNSRGGDTYFNGGGNFGINTDVPSAKLEVFSGSTTADALTLSFTTGADNRSTGIFFKGGPYPYARIVGGTSSYGPDQGFIAFYTNYNPSGAASTSGYCLERVRINPNGSIVATGDITAFGSPSDARLKNIKEVIPNALTSILKLSGYRFDWKEVNHLTKIKEDMGVIAQEVEKVLPELARINDDGTMSVRYQGLTAVLIEAVKEQQTQIESQKSEIDELKDLVKQLINK